MMRCLTLLIIFGVVARGLGGPPPDQDECEHKGCECNCDCASQGQYQAIDRTATVNYGARVYGEDELDMDITDTPVIDSRPYGRPKCINRDCECECNCRHDTPIINPTRVVEVTVTTTETTTTVIGGPPPAPS